MQEFLMWCSRIRTLYYLCSGSGHAETWVNDPACCSCGVVCICGSDFIPGPGTSICHGCAQKRKTHEKKQNNPPPKVQDNPKCMGHSKGSSKRKVYSNKILSQQRRKISCKQPKLTTKVTRERRTNQTPS